MLPSSVRTRVLAGFMLAPAAAHAACLAVSTDKILVRDLATAISLFRDADQDSVIGFSPFPGTTRVLSSRDVLLAARRFGLEFSPSEAVPSLCVERVVAPLSIHDLRTALWSALDGTSEEVHLEIIEFSNKRVPPGRLVFPLAGLNRPPANQPGAPVIWTGKLIYDGQSSLSVWAKVRISVERQVFLAKRAISERNLIQEDDVATAVVTEFPWPPHPSLPSSAIIGKVARHAIPVGTRISPDGLDDADAVRRGDILHVKVISGAAIIGLDAVAQSSGTKGERILVHNLSTGKPFRAVIEDREHAMVDATPASGSL
jgi:flagella basal body P-ring formation protein FlgA